MTGMDEIIRSGIFYHGNCIQFEGWMDSILMVGGWHSVCIVFGGHLKLDLD